MFPPGYCGQPNFSVPGDGGLQWYGGVTFFSGNTVPNFGLNMPALASYRRGRGEDSAIS